MRAGEYNPMHFHRSAKSDVGLSSVLVLKRPETYGKEYSVDILSESGKRIVSGLQEIETEIKEKTNNF